MKPPKLEDLYGDKPFKRHLENVLGGYVSTVIRYHAGISPDVASQVREEVLLDLKRDRWVICKHAYEGLK
jgi:hypothetical protein